MRYLCYISKERVDSLFEVAFDHVVDSVEVKKTSEDNVGVGLSISAVLDLFKAGLKFGHKDSNSSVATGRVTAVNRLTDVVKYLEAHDLTSDLSWALAEDSPLTKHWYLFSSELTVRNWEGESAAIELAGHLEGWELRLACRTRDFSGLYEEAGKLIPTSTNYYLFRGEISLPMSGLVRIVSKSKSEKVVRAAPLFLVLNPLNVDLGAHADVAL